MSPLKTWLQHHEARCMWQQPVPSIGLLECFCMPGARVPLHPMILVLTYAGGGWDIFAQTTGSNGVHETLRSVELRLGLRVSNVG